MVFDNASMKNGDINTTAAPERDQPAAPALTNIFVELTADRLYAIDTDGVNIIHNASTVNGTPPVVRVIASGGSTFKAVATKP